MMCHRYVIGNFSIALDAAFFPKLPFPYSLFYSKDSRAESDLCLRGTVAFANVLGPDEKRQLSAVKSSFAWIERKGALFLICAPSFCTVADTDSANLWVFEQKSSSEFVLHLEKSSYCSGGFEERLANSLWMQRLCTYVLWRHGVFIVHGAATAGRYGGVVFIGDSGAGKSTIYRLLENANNCKPFSDDRLLLCEENRQIKVHGTPWNTTNPLFSANMSAPVKTILFLKHGQSNALRVMGKEEIYRKMLHQIDAPKPINRKIRNLSRLALVGKLMQEASCCEFSFLPDETAVEALKRERII